MKKAEFDIQGMTCSSCQSHVEKAVCKLEGTKKVNVNLLSNQMKLEYDENLLNQESIIKAIVDAGYGATIAGQNEKNKDKAKAEREDNNSLKSMKHRLLISIIFWIPLMYIAMYHMFYEWFGLPIPQVIMHWV